MTRIVRLLAFSLICLIATGVAAPALAQDAEAFAADVDAFVEETLEAFAAVPGVAIAVVHGSETVFLRGFGEADREAGTPATPETPFYIASATKPFTALAAALLDARGTLDLDAPITRYLPDVDFDPSVEADNVTLRDLLTHTHGLENDAVVFRTAFSGEHTPEALHAVLAATTPNPDAPRGTFEYTNLGYNILSLILDRETGRPWQDLLGELLFTPLGMTHTTAYASEAMRDGAAAPYFGLGDEGPVQLYLSKQDNTMHAAGGLYASAADLARWLEVQLNHGRLDGQQVVPAALIEEAHRRHAETDARFLAIQRTGYGLGWYHGMLDGEPLMHHFGGFAGFHAHVSFMPQHRLGVAVLLNESGMGARLGTLFASYIYARWTQGAEAARPFIEMRDGWLTEELPRIRERIAADRARRAERMWTLSQPPDAYAGTYANDLYGTLLVEVEDGVPVAHIGNLHATATPFTAPDAIRVSFVPPRGEVIAFEVAEDGTVLRARYDDAVFERVH